MNILQFLKKLRKKTPQKQPLIQSEEQYYEQLFVKNPKWNKPDPNSEEILRWEIIKTFVEYAKGITQKQPEPYEILDLGSGRGWLTNLLSDYGNVKGIEPVKPVVDHAKKIFPNIDFVCGSSKDLLSQETIKKYDLIVSSEVIEHIPDDKKAGFVNDINDLLNNKGFVIITTPRSEVQEEWNKYLGANQPIEDWISEKELKELFIKNSFKEIKIKRIAIPPVEKSPEIDIYQLWLFQKN